MAQEQTTYEMDEKFADLLDRVERGERVAITRHGVQVATMVPAESNQERADRAVERLRERRKSISLEGLTVMDLIEEGRPK